MMKNKTKLSVAVIVLGLMAFATQLRATTIFSDDFNSENGGAGFLNYGTPNQNGDGGAGSINTAFANWVVTAGGVDLIPLDHVSPTFGTNFDLTPGQGHGLYVDMEGTNTGQGTLTLRNALLLGPGNYTLFYDMAGNQRTSVNDLVITTVVNGVPTPIATQVQNLSEFSPWTTYSLPFSLASTTSVKFIFQDGGDFDNIGNLLDNVRLDGPNVPEGGTTTLSLLGVALVSIPAIKRKLVKWIRR